MISWILLAISLVAAAIGITVRYCTPHSNSKTEQLIEKVCEEIIKDSSGVDIQLVEIDKN